MGWIRKEKKTMQAMLGVNHSAANCYFSPGSRVERGNRVGQ
jgi:hypothetical protein